MFEIFEGNFEQAIKEKAHDGLVRTSQILHTFNGQRYMITINKSLIMHVVRVFFEFDVRFPKKLWITEICDHMHLSDCEKDIEIFNECLSVESSRRGIEKIFKDINSNLNKILLQMFYIVINEKNCNKETCQNPTSKILLPGDHVQILNKSDCSHLCGIYIGNNKVIHENDVTNVSDELVLTESDWSNFYGEEVDNDSKKCLFLILPFFKLRNNEKIVACSIECLKSEQSFKSGLKYSNEFVCYCQLGKDYYKDVRLFIDEGQDDSIPACFNSYNYLSIFNRLTSVDGVLN
jgi:hypothetical protein